MPNRSFRLSDMPNSSKDLPRHPIARSAILLEALAFLTIFKLGLGLVSVNRIIRFVTGKTGESRDTCHTVTSDARDLDETMWAIRVVVRRSPVEFVCFPQ